MREHKWLLQAGCSLGKKQHVFLFFSGAYCAERDLSWSLIQLGANTYSI